MILWGTEKCKDVQDWRNRRNMYNNLENIGVMFRPRTSDTNWKKEIYIGVLISTENNEISTAKRKIILKLKSIPM